MRWTPEDLAVYLNKRQSEIQKPDQPDQGLESRLQAKCLKYLKEHGWPVWHDWSRKKNQAGFPDLICFLPKGRTVLIELKAGNAKLRKEQEQLKITLSYLGHGIKVCRSFKRFLEIIKEKTP